MYVEQMIAAAIGPHVSKITLAIENTPGTLVPTVQIAMPTNTLHSMAKQIMHILSNPDTQKQLEQALTGSLNEMKS